MNEAEKLLSSLANGESVRCSPEILGLIEEMDLPFERSGEQVKLQAPLELLDKSQITSGLGVEARNVLSVIEVHWSIGSTNTYLMDQIGEPHFHGSVCLAERQIAGKGRRGRHWVSPFGKNIYLSMGWSLDYSASIEGLSLVVGMQVTKSLKDIGLTEVSLKWPNDIIVNGGKLCGILIEVGASKQGSKGIVIGVGVNLHMDERHAKMIDQPWSAVDELGSVSRNDLTARLIDNIFGELARFSKTGFQPYQSEWRKYDLYYDQVIRVLMGDKSVEGNNKGVDKFGNLLLETSDGIKSYNAGEVSLRPLNR